MGAWRTRNPALQWVIEQAERLACTGQNLLLQGEPGTGKERLARHIHAHAHAHPAETAGPFVRVDCSAVSGGPGPGGGPALSAGATLFLDGFDGAAPAVRATLLQAARQAGARVIASAGGGTASLAEAANLVLPPLRERKEDLEFLTRELLAELSEPGHDPAVLTADAIAAILLHRWPGNVSELKRTLRRALLLASGSPIDLRCLPPGVAANLQSNPPRQLFKRYMRSAELLLIRWALSACNDDRTRAAKFLGLSRAALYKKLKLYTEFTVNP